MLDLATPHHRDQARKISKPEKFEDEYEDALKDLFAKKQKGEKIEQPEGTPAPANVINLMDALRNSVKAEGGRAPAPPRPRRSARKAARKSKASARCCSRSPAKSPLAKSNANRRGPTAGSGRPAKRLVSSGILASRPALRPPVQRFFRRRRLPSVTQAFLDLSLGAYLRQHLLDQVTRKRKPRVARALVRGRAGEMFDLGTDRLLETLHIAVGPVEREIGAHQSDQMQQRGKRRRRGFRKGSADFLTVPLGALPVGEAALVVEASLSPGSAAPPGSAMMVF